MLVPKVAQLVAALLALWICAGFSVPAIASDCLVPVLADGGLRIGRVEIVTEPDKTGLRLVVTENGVYRLGADGRLEPLRGERPRGTFFVTDPDRTGVRFVGAQDGVFRLSADGRLARVSNEASAKGVRLISDPDEAGSRVVATFSGGLYRLETGRRLVRVPVDGDTVLGEVRAILELERDGRRLVLTENGLFRIGREGPALAVDAGPATGKVSSVGDLDQSGMRLIGSQRGLFRLGPVGPLVRVTGAPEAITGQVHTVTRPDKTGVRFIGADKGDFLLGVDGRLTPISFQEAWARKFVSVSDALDVVETKVGTRVGLFRKGPRDLLVPIPGGADSDTGTVSDIRDLDYDGLRLVVAERGLFLLRNEGQVTPVRGGEPAATGEVATGYSAPGAEPWFVGAENGLFRYTMRPVTPVRAVRRKAESVTFTLDQRSECLSFAGSDDFGLENADHKSVGRTSFIPDRREVVANLDHAPIVGQKLTVFLVRKGPADKTYRISGPVRWRAPVDWKALSVRGGLALLALHSAVFLGLVLLANRSDRAAGLLMHPLSKRFGLWWSAAVQYSPTLQRWILGAWFRRRKAILGSQTPIVPLAITVERGAPVLSDKIGARLSPGCRIWLQGEPGMGKTEILRQIEARFFAHATLQDGVAAFGFIPLLVPLRNLSDPGKGDRDWLVRVAEAVLSGQGFLADENSPTHNAGLVASFLRRSGFVLLLDGANEVPWQVEIAHAAAAVDRPGLLVTSQAPPVVRADVFKLWRLPPDMSRAVQPLLKLYLGDAAGDLVFARLRSLLLELKSGFDVRLVESLHRAGVTIFPVTRIELYRAFVARLFPTDSRSASARLHAVAWTQWLSGARQFSLEDLDSDLRDAFESDDLGVTRLVGGARREFRHDQMRGFLAASHVVGAANPLGVIAHAEANWPQIASEQDLVWQFVFDLADEALRRRIYEWSLEVPEDRIRLQVSFAGIRAGARN